MLNPSVNNIIFWFIYNTYSIQLLVYIPISCLTRELINVVSSNLVISNEVF